MTTKPITSLQNARIKAAIRLRDRKGREQQSRIIIDGLREIRRAYEAGVEFKELFTCESLIESQEARDVLSSAEAYGYQCIEVSPQVWEKLTFGNRQDGLLVVATPPSKTLSDLERSQRPFIVILDGVEKPGNVGAVIRTADGAGADAVILTNSATDIYNPNAIRSSIGTIFHTPVVSATCTDAIEWLRQNDIMTFLAIVSDATVIYTELQFPQATAIVLGSEAHGISEPWRSAKDFHHMHLPMRGAADSLNVSAATAALLYEVVRQRG